MKPMVNGNPVQHWHSQKVGWDDVAEIDSAKECLIQAVETLKASSESSVGRRRRWRACLLYGAPGVGKSYLVRAVETAAREAGISFISNVAVGSSAWRDVAKLVRDLFQVAACRSPAIIFLDDVDCMCGTHGSGHEHNSFKLAEAELITQLTDLERSRSDTLVLAATNKPFSLDQLQALVSRFDKRVYIPLPSQRARRLRLEASLRAVPNNLSQDDISDLAEKTEGFTFSDVHVFVREAAMEPVRKVLKASFFHKVVTVQGEESYTPCHPPIDGGQQDPSIIRTTYQELDDQGLNTKVVPSDAQRADFDSALVRMRPSVTEGELAVYESFRARFGDGQPAS